MVRGRSRQFRSNGATPHLQVLTTGPQSVFNVGGVIVMTVSAQIRNTGSFATQAGLRLNLGLDGFFGDSSQLIVEADGALAGHLAPVTTPELNYPVAIPAGGIGQVLAKLHVFAQTLFDRQGAINGFNWWICEAIVRVPGTTQNIPDVAGESRFEMRDWFKIEAVGAAQLQLTTRPQFVVGQR